MWPTAYSAGDMERNERAAGAVYAGSVLSLLSKEELREAGGAAIMAAAMWICHSGGRRSGAGSRVSVGAISVGVLCTVVAVVASSLAIFLPDYLRRSGFVGPEHCGLEGL